MFVIGATLISRRRSSRSPAEAGLSLVCYNWCPWPGLEKFRNKRGCFRTQWNTSQSCREMWGRLSLASQTRERGQLSRMVQYWTDVRKKNGWRTRSLTMGPVLGRRKLTVRSRLGWVPRQVEQSRNFLLGRSPEYWVEHMGRDRAVAAALRLHHDASLIMTNVQVLAQFVTGLNRTASEVMRTVYEKEPFPTNAVEFVTPGRRVRRAAHYMAAMGLWRPTSGPVFPGPVPVSSCNSCMSCEDCFPDVPQWQSGFTSSSHITVEMYIRT